MKAAKAPKAAGASQNQQQGPLAVSTPAASPKPVRSWSKVAASSSSTSPAPAQRQSGAASEQASRDTQDASKQSSHDKLLEVFARLINTEADVRLKNGQKYRGTIKSVDAQGDVSVVLKNAIQLEDTTANMNGSNSMLSEISIKAEDLVDILATKLDLGRANTTSGLDARVSQGPPRSGAWKTDVDISGRAAVKERELQAWQPDPDVEAFGIEDDPTLSSKTNQSGKKWDQFAANERLFGVKSQWDEDVYTHKLDTTGADFAARQAEAAKLAREIESSATTNSHILEERGIAVDDSGLTEEDKYSGVQRSSNAWLAPARRAAANLPVRTAPADPAIISSQLAKPGSDARAPPKEILSDQTQNSMRPIESHIMAQFKQFASGERDRLAVKKAATFKKEKDGRLQDLMKFSKDFKLNTPVPEDLVPILAKDKAKQEAIVQKAVSGAPSPVALKVDAASPSPADAKSSDTLRARIDKAHQSPTPLAPVTPIPRDELIALKKLKPSASEFKPFNPAASAFAPSFSAAKTSTAPSPVLSTTSSQQRPGQFNSEIVPFFTKKPKPLSERIPILAEFNPFKTYREKNPDATIDIEAPYKTLPAWPSAEGAPSLFDPPKEVVPSKTTLEEGNNHAAQLQSQGSYSPSPQNPAMYTMAPQQMYAFPASPQYYGVKGPQQYMPPGQYAYQAGPQFVPQAYMYPQQQIYPQRGTMQPQMIPVPYVQQPQFYGVPQMMGAPSYMGYRADNLSNNASPRQRTTSTNQHHQSPREQQKPATRPPPMGSSSTDDPSRTSTKES